MDAGRQMVKQIHAGNLTGPEYDPQGNYSPQCNGFRDGMRFQLRGRGRDQLKLRLTKRVRSPLSVEVGH